jgi:uncharacterized protein YceH (UPF0502 family)
LAPDYCHRHCRAHHKETTGVDPGLFLGIQTAPVLTEALVGGWPKGTKMNVDLNPIEARALGSLIEKELSIPDYYPLSLNALLNACNQKSNRDPVLDCDEETVQAAIDGLIRKGLVWESAAGRVPKFEERFTIENKLVPRESAILCVLLLRGDQTVGEIRGRTGRMYNFESLEQVEQTLAHLEDNGFLQRLPRLPGQKESRYGHRLGSEARAQEQTAAPPAGPTASVKPGRMDRIESDIAALRGELEALKTEFQELKKRVGWVG